MSFKIDESGLHSLSGYAYQIKVFALYTAELKDGMTLEFETIEDVNLKSEKDIDRHDFLCKMCEKETNIAIQVKHTSVTKEIAKKIILNWMLLEHSSYSIEKYILFTDDKYENKESIFSFGSAELYDKVIDSKKKANSIYSKVKSIYGDDLVEFDKHFQEVKRKYMFKSLKNIDDELEEKFDSIFRKAYNIKVFEQRLKEFLMNITASIFESVAKKESYSLTYKNFYKMIEDICKRFTVECTYPSYTAFKSNKQIDLKDNEIASSREYHQLSFCSLPENLMIQHLLHGMYFKHFRYLKMEQVDTTIINNIEVTTFENFVEIVSDLRQNGKDLPFNRLKETINKPNSYAINTQIQKGCAIYLTADDINERQISWKDNEDE